MDSSKIRRTFLKRHGVALVVILLMIAPGAARAQQEKPGGPVDQDLLDLLVEYTAFRTSYPDSAFTPA